MYDFAVFVGRFQPFHAGHRHVVHETLKQADKLIIVIGSHGNPRSSRNPFTVAERERIIIQSLSAEYNERILFACVPDFIYNDDKWTAAVQGAVYSVVHRKFRAGPTSIALTGMYKDASSYYLNKFPNWESIAVEPLSTSTYFEPDGPTRVSTHASTEIRNEMFHDLNTLGFVQSNSFAEMTNEAEMEMGDIIEENLDDFRTLAQEWNFEKEYKKKWGKGPHNTVDAIVVQAAHILLIQRGKEYGTGKWALPGGFINNDEFITDAMLRELSEETKIKVPEKVLRGCIVNSKVYDNPYRDLRSRNISHAFHIRLNDVGKLPTVRGSDDAMDARWFSISEFQKMKEKMYGDHYDLICDMLGL